MIIINFVLSILTPKKQRIPIHETTLLPAVGLLSHAFILYPVSIARLLYDSGLWRLIGV